MRLLHSGLKVLYSELEKGRETVVTSRMLDAAGRGERRGCHSLFAKD